MTRIAAADQLAALMRAQIASLRRDAGARNAPGGKAGAPSAPAKGQTDLALLAAQRIREIAPDDPQRSRKAMRAFLECVVLSELGADLVRDPAFVRMMDHVQAQMESNPELAAATQEAAQALLAQPQA